MMLTCDLSTCTIIYRRNQCRYMNTVVPVAPTNSICFVLSARSMNLLNALNAITNPGNWYRILPRLPRIPVGSPLRSGEAVPVQDVQQAVALHATTSG